MRKPHIQAPASPGPGRGSLRAELLFNLTFLALAAGLLAGTTIAVAQRVRPGGGWILGAMLVVDVVIYVLLANYLIVRLVLRPVQAAAATAQAVAAGDYARRAPKAESREMEDLSQALNRMADQLLENQEKLAHNVQSLDDTNRRLLAATRDLVEAEKLASIGRLAAGVAHEVGNPLGALLGYAALLRRRGADPELANGVQAEARRIDRIVRGLLDYARPAPPERAPVDVNAAVHAAVGSLRVRGVLAQVQVDLRLADGLPPVTGSADLLQQAFVNLLDNARLSMDGQGAITVSTRLERYQAEGARVPARRADDPPGISYAHLRRKTVTSVRDPHRIEPGTETVRITVADTGPGIPPENIDKVFDPFFTTRPPGEGTGLGLAIVASTVADFGGRIEASSAGGGAVFTLSLPTRRPS